MKRKFITTIVAAFSFITMMSVATFASTAATVRLDAGAITDGYVDVAVHVDVAEGAAGVSALVVDVNYTNVQRQAAEQRQFTATVDGASVNVHTAQVTSGITVGDAFGMTFDQFISPPAAPAPLRLYFEMAGDGVLTTGGQAATIRFSVPEGVDSAVFTPVLHSDGGHAFAYRWTAGGGYEHIPAAQIALVGDRIGVTFVNLPGDVNRDGAVDTADVLLLRQYDAMFDVAHLICRVNADVTGDGNVDTADVLRLRQYDAMFLVELLPSPLDPCDNCR